MCRTTGRRSSASPIRRCRTARCPVAWAIRCRARHQAGKTMARSYYDLQAVQDYLLAGAQRRGMDPRIALRVAKSEGLAPGTWQSNVVKNGRRERSYGPFQLYVDGGLGNQFKAQTG